MKERPKHALRFNVTSVALLVVLHLVLVAYCGCRDSSGHKHGQDLDQEPWAHRFNVGMSQKEVLDEIGVLHGEARFGWVAPDINASVELRSVYGVDGTNWHGIEEISAIMADFSSWDIRTNSLDQTQYVSLEFGLHGKDRLELISSQEHGEDSKYLSIWPSGATGSTVVRRGMNPLECYQALNALGGQLGASNLRVRVSESNWRKIGSWGIYLLGEQDFYRLERWKTWRVEYSGDWAGCRSVLTFSNGVIASLDSWKDDQSGY